MEGKERQGFDGNAKRKNLNSIRSGLRSSTRNICTSGWIYIFFKYLNELDLILGSPIKILTKSFLTTYFGSFHYLIILNNKILGLMRKMVSESFVYKIYLQNIHLIKILIQVRNHFIQQRLVF